MIIGNKVTDLVEINDLLERMSETTDCVALSGAAEIGASRAILQVVKTFLDENRKLLETRPEKNDVDIMRDFRVKLGMVTMAKIVLSLPDVARSTVEAVDDPEV